MRKFTDESGWVRAVVCCVALLLHHGLRDALITAIPTIAGASPPAPNATSASPTTTDSYTDQLYNSAASSVAAERANVSSPVVPEAVTSWSTELSAKTLTPAGPVPQSALTPGTTVTSLVAAGGQRSGGVVQEQPVPPHASSLLVRFVPLLLGLSSASRSVRGSGGGRAENSQDRSGVSDRKSGGARAPPAESDDSWWDHGGRGEAEEGPPAHWLHLKSGWTLAAEGAILSAVYWGWLLTTLLADRIIDRVGAALVLAGSLGAAGLVGLLTHAASLAGPWVLLLFRLLLGLLQGLSYPSVVRVLEGLPEDGRASLAFLVFTGPYLGTCMGASLGGLPHWYIVVYVAGTLALSFAPFCLMLPYHHTTTHKKGLWGRVVRSQAVWACVGVHVANMWVLHTLLLGLPFCLAYSALSQPAASGWMVTVVMAVVGVVVQTSMFVSPHFADRGPLDVLNRRRVPVVTGSFMVLVAAIVLATAGMTSTDTLVGVAAGLAGVGVGVTRVGYRLNLVDIAPCQMWRLSRVLDVGGVVTAALTPLLLTGLLQVGGGGWRGVWLMPLAAVLPAAVLYIFLITTNPQPWDEPEGGMGVEGKGVNGCGPPREARMSVRSGQSFKTARSAFSFKTAISRTRTRTISCRTVDDDLEADMHSVVDEASIECHSVAEEADPECFSIASFNTFKSDGADMQSVIDSVEPDVLKGQQQPPPPDQFFGSVLCNGTITDRTTAWLTYHHDIVIGNSHTTHTPPTKAQAHQGNAIYGLFW